MKATPKSLALIGIGSNLNQPKHQVEKAIAALNVLPETQVAKASSLYQSKPQGPQDQNLFCNAVALIETRLNPSQLLLALQNIEQQFGRVKLRHWGERVIDLDVLFYAQESIRLDTPNLTIPHPHALSRDFVMIPALEICPDWELPDGSLLKQHLSACLDHHLQRID